MLREGDGRWVGWNEWLEIIKGLEGGWKAMMLDGIISKVRKMKEALQ